MDEKKYFDVENGIIFNNDGSLAAVASDLYDKTPTEELYKIGVRGLIEKFRRMVKQ